MRCLGKERNQTPMFQVRLNCFSIRLFFLFSCLPEKRRLYQIYCNSVLYPLIPVPLFKIPRLLFPTFTDLYLYPVLLYRSTSRPAASHHFRWIDLYLRSFLFSCVPDSYFLFPEFQMKSESGVKSGQVIPPLFTCTPNNNTVSSEQQKRSSNSILIGFKLYNPPGYTVNRK